MKRYLLAVILFSFCAISLSSCKKEQGCTDPTASNFDAEAEEDDGSCDYIVIDNAPSIEIIKPSGNMEITGELELEVKFTDDTDLELATFTLSSDQYPGGVYYSTTRALDGTERTIYLTVDLIDVPLTGNNYLLVNATDGAGNTESKGVDFKLEDTTEPVLSNITYSEDQSLDYDVELAFDVQDFGGLVSVKVEFYASEFDGNEALFDDDLVEYPVPVFDKRSFEYTFDTYWVYYGPYRIVITATDDEGNQIVKTLEGNLEA